MYKIVIFDNENATEGVPSKWIKEVSDQHYCFWPLKMKREKVAKLIKENADHSSSWTLLRCRIKCEAASYEEMKIKAKQAEIVTSQAEASDSESVDESSEVDEPCATPSPPRKKKKVVEAVDRTRPNAEKLNRLLTKFEKFEHKLSSIDNKVTQSIAGNEILQKEIADVKEELRLLKKYCKKIPSANPETTKTLASKSVLPDLPLKNLEDLLAMDKLLSSSQEERHNLIEILKGLGGIHIRSVVHNMMRTCLTKEVSVQFSLKGKTNKRNFSELNIYECIKDAALQHPHAKDVHPSDVVQIIARNLIQSKQRVNTKKDNDSAADIEDLEDIEQDAGVQDEK